MQYKKEECDMIGAKTVAKDCGWWNMLAGFFGYLILE